MKITAAVVPARSQPFLIQQLYLAAPLADEVLVRIVASGLCHTDLHARDGYFPNLPYPIVCGHEGAGIVEAVGAAVTDLAPGDPVVISFPYCGECEPCQEGRISYCTNARGLKSGGRRADGSTPMSRDGAPVYSCFFQQSSFATFALAPATAVVKIRRDAPVAMLGPLGCGLQAGAGAGLTVRGVIQGDSQPRDFIPRLVDFFIEGRFPLDRIVTRYALADINRAAADAASGATINPVLTLPH